MTRRPYPYRTPQPAWRRQIEPWPFLAWLEARCREQEWEYKDLARVCGLTRAAVHLWCSPQRGLPSPDACAALAQATGTPIPTVVRLVQQSRIQRSIDRFGPDYDRRHGARDATPEELHAVADRLVLRLRQNPERVFLALSSQTRGGLLRYVLTDLQDFPATG